MPNLLVKDLMLYRAVYCGVCKGIAGACGQRARLGLTYDIAFFSALLHNIAGEDISVEPQHCFEHAIKKRPIAVADEMSKKLGAFNTMLAYLKLDDDVRDGAGGRFKRSFFKKGYKRARKSYPALGDILTEYMRAQGETEEKNTASLDMAAEPTAQMLSAFSRDMLGDKATESVQTLFYSIGKWVYLIDALDDYDKDVKTKSYNPFVLSYGAPSREELMKEKGEEVRFLFDTLFYGLREALGGVKFYFNRDLTDNILLRGLPTETARVMKGEPRHSMPAKL